MYRLLAFSSLEILYKLGLPVQAFTVFHLLVLLIFPFFFLIKKIKYSSISLLIVFFYFYSLIITTINMIIAIAVGTDRELYNPVFRQITGLTLGIMTFFVLRIIFEKNPIRSLKFIKYSLFIILLFILLFDIILNGKFYRLYGSFTEPSHLGQYLVFILLPCTLLLRISPYKDKKLDIILGMLLVLIFLTFSLSTYIRLFLFLFFCFLIGSFKEKFKYFMYSTLALFVFIIIFSTIFKNSYVFIQASKNLEALLSGLFWEAATISLIDRVQFILLIKNFFNLGLNSLWGSGLGFEKMFMHSLYPPNILDMILNVKQVESYINSFWGKILVYCGLMGGFLFILILVFTIKISSKLFDAKYKKIIIAILLAIYIYAIFGLAPFQTMELWFWIAFVDAYYIYIRRYR